MISSAGRGSGRAQLGNHGDESGQVGCGETEARSGTAVVFDVRGLVVVVGGGGDNT